MEININYLTAHKIENVIRMTIDCERFDVNGAVDEGIIEAEPYATMRDVLVYLCSQRGEHDASILAKFVEDYFYLNGHGMNAIREMNDGKEKLDAMINAFTEACEKLK